MIFRRFSYCALIVIVTCLRAAASSTPPGGTYKGCPAEGAPKPTGLEAEVAEPVFLFINNELNRLKNRADQAVNPSTTTVAELNGKAAPNNRILPNSRTNLLAPLNAAILASRSISNAGQRAQIIQEANHRTLAALSEAFTSARAYENEAVVSQGYLASDVGAKSEGPESPNCYGESGDDYHIWLVDAVGDPRSVSAVVEMTPRWKDYNQSWKLERLHRFSVERTLVKITGWLLFDPEHPNEVGKTRGGQWEIHPITKVEYFEQNSWHEL
ncbi:MAG: hypothetical protein JOZ77_03475 [Candidatus Eremiobacteraeota bacterium]|nr:hypothetical protein [Candidatus Eremiobacteraeota bacterium]